MKIPLEPPNFNLLTTKYMTPDDLMSIYTGDPDVDLTSYLHWDQIRHRTPPEGLNHEQWWFKLKAHRLSRMRPLRLLDADDKPFRFMIPDWALEVLHEVDFYGGGRIEFETPVANPETRQRYYVNSLIEESITSSQIEGALTTKRVAKSMILSKRKPRNRSEQMILNNYMLLEEVKAHRDQELTRETLLQWQHIATINTLKDEKDAGRFRDQSDPIEVVDEMGRTLHVPPPADQLEDRVQRLLEFANDQDRIEPRILPVIKAAILHFWLAYDHPFCDGNGRTARALFYWYLLKKGYWVFDYLSISRTIKKSHGQYGRAYLYSETDDNDLTYFILYHLKVIKVALDELKRYFRKKSNELHELDQILKNQQILNHRQKALISRALRKRDSSYTLGSHKTSHGISYETARKDLTELVDLGLLTCEKVGRKYVYRPIRDIEQKLARLTR